MTDDRLDFVMTISGCIIFSACFAWAIGNWGMAPAIALFFGIPFVMAGFIKMIRSLS